MTGNTLTRPMLKVLRELVTGSRVFADGNKTVRALRCRNLVTLVVVHPRCFRATTTELGRSYAEAKHLG